MCAHKRDIVIFSFSTENFADEVHVRIMPRLGPAVGCAVGVPP